MKIFNVAVVIGQALTFGILVYAQESAARLTQNPRLDATDRTVMAELHPAEPVPSLEILLVMSPLIIDGTVTAVLPAVKRASPWPDAIETHSLVSIREVIAGRIPGDARQIVLGQEGGRVGFAERLTNDPLVKVGDRYLLFLAPDRRQEPANTAGSPRYYAVGIWAGKIKVERERIKVSAECLPGLREHDSENVDSFIAKVIVLPGIWTTG